MYKEAKNDKDADERIEFIRGTLGESTSDLKLSDGLCNPRYRQATWINIGYMIFHELAGINVINMYSNTMFHKMQNNGASFTPREGTYLIGVIQVLATAMST